MNKKMSHFRLGIFVVVAVVILVVLIVSVGGGNAWRRKVVVETYFDESVQGLDIGSKVRYRGVVIGAVSRISFTYTEYEQDKAPADRKQYVLVEMAVYPELLGDVGGGQRFVAQLVQDGLRVRMAPVGITGIVYLEIDFTRNNAVLPINWQPQHLYIPSTRSTVLNFVDSLEHLMDKLAPVDLDRTMAKIDKLLTTLNGKVDALDTEKLSREMSATLADLHGTLREVSQLVGREEWKSVPADLSATARRLREIAESPELKRTLTALERSSQRIDRALDGREQDVSELIVNLRAASANLRSLSESLKRDPAGTLLAKPPKPSDIFAPR
ncbi:MAG TPA: MlaD family protein [Rhodocyclaceae bacterium]|nr:MlaD family protein [Rhodocyclaceae bacterium]